MAVTVLPSDFALRQAVLAVLAGVADIGTLEPDPIFAENPAEYQTFVKGHGIVAEYGGKSPSGAGGPYEAVHRIDLHAFRGHNTAKPSGGKTRGEAFAEALAAADVALHNSPRLGLLSDDYVIKHRGLAIEGSERVQSDLFNGYYALGTIEIVVGAC